MTDMETKFVAIAGLCEGSRSLMRWLDCSRKPYLILTNSKHEEKELLEGGAGHVLHMDTKGGSNPAVPPVSVSDVFIFEGSLALSCRYIQCCRDWASGAIYVITRNWNPKAIYTGLGATFVIYSRTGDVGFLLRNGTLPGHTV